MKKFEVVEKHNTYLRFIVEAETEEQAIEKVNQLGWDEANSETTEFENVDVQEVYGETT